METTISLRRGLKIPCARYISTYGALQLRVLGTQLDPRALVAPEQLPATGMCRSRLPVSNPATIGYVASSSEVQSLPGRKLPSMAVAQISFHLVERGNIQLMAVRCTLFCVVRLTHEWTTFTPPR